MLKRASVVAAALVALLAVAGYVQAGPGGPPEQRVREQNLDSNGWIAVHEQGTANVNVTGGSVAVAGGSVNVAGGSVSVDGSTVDVGNLPAVQTVADANHPALQPFVQSESGKVTGVNDPNCIDVPPGKRAVLEHVSGEISVPTGVRPYRVSMRTMVDGSTHTTFLEPTVIRPNPSGFDNGFDNLHFGGPISAFADDHFQGSELCLTVWRHQSSPDWNFAWSVAGYLVDL